METQKFIKSDREELLKWNLRKLYFVMMQIKGRFYQEKGFLLTSDASLLRSEVKSNLVYIPESITELLKVFDWEKVDLVRFDENWFESDFSEIVGKDILRVVKQELISISLKINEKEIAQILDEIKRFFKIGQISLEIYPTILGSEGTYTPTANIVVLPRVDSDIFNIIYGIVGAISRTENREVAWNELDAINRFVAKRLSGIDRIRTAAEITPVIKEQSDALYAGFGFAGEKLFTVNENKILFNKSEINELTKSEDKLLSEFILNSGKVLDYEYISNLMGQSVDDFSMQAITKMIERLRKKIRSIGYSGEVIFTKSGRGYYWME